MNKPKCEPIGTEDLTKDLKEWLKKQARCHELKYLLAHADDGVIWGKFDENQNHHLKTADEVFSDLAKLRLITLRQCRLFGPNTEVMLWRVGEDENNSTSWKACSINDEGLEEEDYILEKQILWGTQTEEETDGFTLVSDGSEGLKHAIPLPLASISFSSDKPLHRPLRLQVRHYIDYDEDGLARIYLSRLVNLHVSKD